jgi:hypothetical protein
LIDIAAENSIKALHLLLFVSISPVPHPTYGIMELNNSKPIGACLLSRADDVLVLICYHPEIHLLAVLFPIICKPISIIVLFLVYGIRPSIY